MGKLADDLRQAFEGHRAVIYALIPLIDKEARLLVETDQDYRQETFHSDLEVFLNYLVHNGIEDRDMLKMIAGWWKEQREHAQVQTEQEINKLRGRKQ
jgi:hypothetical protein